jgi:NAD(P)H-dependent FMN reductase
VRILAVSGSLRTASSNTALLRAAVRLAPRGAEVALYEGLAGLPHFNPDLDDPDGGRPVPSAVADLRSRLAASDGVLISSPEYAHGVPGSLKNALDWVVGSGELYGRPVAVVNASPRATHARASLVEVLKTMDANLVEEASVTVPLPTNGTDEAVILSDPGLSRALGSAVAALAREAVAHRVR